MCGPDSAQMGDFVQCCYVLLESGAQIDVNDLNGVRPVDVFKVSIKQGIVLVQCPSHE
jgi:hypothetical protein